MPNLSARTQRDYRKLLDRHIVKRLGGYRLRGVTVTVVDDFKAKLLAAGVGESQTRQALAVLSRMFTYAERRGRMSKKPVRLVKKPSSRRKRAVVCLAPSAVELARAILLEEARYGDAALICLLAYAGPRPQEVLALEWRHVRERTLLFEQKNVDGEIMAGRDGLGELDRSASGSHSATSSGHGAALWAPALFGRRTAGSRAKQQRAVGASPQAR